MLRVGPTRAVVWASVLVASGALALPGRADGPLGPDGAPITTSDYSIDLYRGPVLSSSRVTGLGGAATAIAEGTEGGLLNPAAVAARPPQSVDFWDYWYGLGMTYPFDSKDFFHSGARVEPLAAGLDSSFLYFNPGGYLQLWGVGFGLNVDIGIATLSNEAGDSLDMQMLLNHVQVGYQFLDGELTVGGGLQIARQRVLLDYQGSRRKLFTAVGFGGELGVLYRPRYQRWRLAGSLFSSTQTRPRFASDQVASGSDDIMVGPVYLPETTVNPWRGALGFVYQLGPRPTNTPVHWVRQVVAEQLAALDRRAEAVKRALDEDLAALEAQGAPPQEIDAREVTGRADLKAIAEEREALMKKTWRMLRAQVRHGWPREYLLFTVDLQISGRVANAVGVESFFAQQVQRSGERITVSPHFGIEGEAVPEWLKLRVGSYVEVSRFEGIRPRGHWTMGFDLRVLHWDVFHIWPEDYLWQITSALDFASGYQAVSLGLGGWY